MGVWVLFTFWLLVRQLSEPLPSIPLGMYLGILNRIVCVKHSTSPATVPKGPNFPTCLPTLVIFPLLKRLFGCTRSALWHANSAAACGIHFPDQGSNPGPLHWGHRVLATGPPGKSLSPFLINKIYSLAQSGLTLCSPTDCSPQGSSVQGIFQARILERVAISSSRGSSQPRDLFCISCNG